MESCEKVTSYPDLISFFEKKKTKIWKRRIYIEKVSLNKIE